MENIDLEIDPNWILETKAYKIPSKPTRLSEGVKRKLILLYKEAKKGNDAATVELITTYNIDVNEIEDIETFKRILDSVESD